MDDITARKIFVLSFGWSVIGGAVCIALSAPWWLTAVVAILTAGIAGYSLGPREVNRVMYEVAVSKDTWSGLGTLLLFLGICSCWYASWAYVLFSADNLPSSVWLNWLWILVPAVLGSLFIGAFLAALCGWVMDMQPFSSAGNNGLYYFPLLRLLGYMMREVPVVNRAIDDGTIPLLIFMTMPFTAPVAIGLILGVFGLDLVVTMAMLPSGTARMAIMFGTMCGVLISTAGVRMEMWHAAALLYGGIGGASLGFGAYYLRWYLLSLKPDCVTAAEAA